MASSHNVELEAAKFLQKLIHESKDEPAKLATKLYVILQHMKSSGKEHSMPYQVISRAMETVINQHGLDIEVLKASRLPVTGGPQIAESATPSHAGSSQVIGSTANEKVGPSEDEMSKSNSFPLARPGGGPNFGGNDYYKGSLSTPSLERKDSLHRSKQLEQTESKKVDGKRKRVDSSSATEGKGKVNKVEAQGGSCGAVGRLKQEDQIQSGGFGPKFNQIQSSCSGASTSPADIYVNQGSSQMISSGRQDDVLPSLGATNIVDHDRVRLLMLDNVKKNFQDVGQNSMADNSMLRGAPFKETGRVLFKEQQLKQLRAQCLVFLAFRNGMAPKPLHLEIALGNVLPKEGVFDGHRPELVGYKEGSSSAGSLTAAHISMKEANYPKALECGSNPPLGPSVHEEDGQHTLSSKNLEVAMQNQTSESQNLLSAAKQSILLSAADFAASSQVDNSDKETRAFAGDNHNVVATEGSNLIPRNVLHEKSKDEEDRSTSTALLPPKYTMLEKWIMGHQKKKLLEEQSWLVKQRKMERKIATCFDGLKKTVSSSEDLSAKTKSVIELKKLQLLRLQRRLKNDFLTDFFKPVVGELDHLRSSKKHRHGRRIKQIERYEQKMKEERQKRIRERQKEFFCDIEVHKERLDDIFKIKRERLRGFNRYVKEFHKRKERIHREKIDRIQREKITLLKINDVEGYLRMVQDVKSDRVKQLLKETEKYLQKLGSKLQDAKTIAKRFEHDMDETQTAPVLEKNESAFENEDECDQAKHYKESNEKYYLMAHSIKEHIAEQPTLLQGGKLREYQMNGLRWLVSLYNNHLNGILADEMGLGKTVQVISLICYLMESKNDRGPFLVVVPSSVLPGWETEINFWAPSVHKIVYAGPPEERRRLFKEEIVHRKFNVLLTTYEYLMNKHDRPKLSKIQWRYIIIDEGHRIKNASCKLNADLRHYQSSHRLLLTGTPLQNNLEELWALLNFLLPNIFNSSEDFSQWFNKPFQSNSDGLTDQALLSEEENLLIINRLHQVLRPFVLRRLKHKVENELPEKIERLIRCEASAYQKLLMKRVEENLGSLGSSKARSVQNSVMELRNICNHPYLSQLHADEVDNFIPRHYLHPIIRLCGKLEMLDRLLPKLIATDHRVLFFSTMTRLLDIMEEYLGMKQYRYLRLDGHTSGGDRGALIDSFNQPNSPYFIFLLSIRAGGVGVNLQAADTVIIFDTDWNPQVDLQAQARAHRIGQKKDVLVLRFETVQTVEEQVRAAAEHKLGVANQSITAGFFDNDTSAEDRREYLESLLRECKKEETVPVLNDDGLNDILARSESEIDVFESIDRKRHEQERATWAKLVCGEGREDSELLPPMPSRLVTDDDLKTFYEAMKVYEVQKPELTSGAGVKRKSEYIGSLDTAQYGRGKRTREVRSYEEQMTEEEFEKMCQVDSPGSPRLKDAGMHINMPVNASNISEAAVMSDSSVPVVVPPPSASVQPQLANLNKDVTPPVKRGRGRPKRVIPTTPPALIPQPAQISQPPPIPQPVPTVAIVGGDAHSTALSNFPVNKTIDTAPISSNNPSTAIQHPTPGFSSTSQPSPATVSATGVQLATTSEIVSAQVKGQGRKTPNRTETPRRRGKRHVLVVDAITNSFNGQDQKLNEQLQNKPMDLPGPQGTAISETPASIAVVLPPESSSVATTGNNLSGIANHPNAGSAMMPLQQLPPSSAAPGPQSMSSSPSVAMQSGGQSQKTQGGTEAPRRRGRRKASLSSVVSDLPAAPNAVSDPKVDQSEIRIVNTSIGQASVSCDIGTVAGEKVLEASNVDTSLQDPNSNTKLEYSLQNKQPVSVNQGSNSDFPGSSMGQIKYPDVADVAIAPLVQPDSGMVKAPAVVPVLLTTPVQVSNNITTEDGGHKTTTCLNIATQVALGSSPAGEGSTKIIQPVDTNSGPSTVTIPPYPPASVQTRRQTRRGQIQGKVDAPRRRGRKPASASPSAPDVSVGQKEMELPATVKVEDSVGNKSGTAGLDPKSPGLTDPSKLKESSVTSLTAGHDNTSKLQGLPIGQNKTADVRYVASMMKEMLSESRMSKTKSGERLHVESQDSHILPAPHCNLAAEVTKGPGDRVAPAISVAQAAASTELQSAHDQYSAEIQRQKEGEKGEVPQEKPVVFGPEPGVAVGSLCTVPLKEQVTEESLDEMPSVPPGFEKSETYTSASKVHISQSELVEKPNLTLMSGKSSNDNNLERSSVDVKHEAGLSSEYSIPKSEEKTIEDETVSDCSHQPKCLTADVSAARCSDLPSHSDDSFVAKSNLEEAQRNDLLVNDDNKNKGSAPNGQGHVGNDSSAAKEIVATNPVEQESLSASDDATPTHRSTAKVGSASDQPERVCPAQAEDRGDQQEAPSNGKNSKLSLRDSSESSDFEIRMTDAKSLMEVETVGAKCITGVFPGKSDISPDNHTAERSGELAGVQGSTENISTEADIFPGNHTTERSGELAGAQGSAENISTEANNVNDAGNCDMEIDSSELSMASQASMGVVGEDVTNGNTEAVFRLEVDTLKAETSMLEHVIDDTSNLDSDKKNQVPCDGSMGLAKQTGEETEMTCQIDDNTNSIGADTLDASVSSSEVRKKVSNEVSSSVTMDGSLKSQISGDDPHVNVSAMDMLSKVVTTDKINNCPEKVSGESSAGEAKELTDAKKPQVNVSAMDTLSKVVATDNINECPDMVSGGSSTIEAKEAEELTDVTQKNNVKFPEENTLNSQSGRLLPEKSEIHLPSYSLETKEPSQAPAGVDVVLIEKSKAAEMDAGDEILASQLSLPQQKLENPSALSVGEVEKISSASEEIKSICEADPGHTDAGNLSEAHPGYAENVSKPETSSKNMDAVASSAATNGEAVVGTSMQDLHASSVVKETASLEVGMGDRTISSIDNETERHDLSENMNQSSSLQAEEDSIEGSASKDLEIGSSVVIKEIDGQKCSSVCDSQVNCTLPENNLVAADQLPCPLTENDEIAKSSPAESLIVDRETVQRNIDAGKVVSSPVIGVVPGSRAENEPQPLSSTAVDGGNIISTLRESSDATSVVLCVAGAHESEIAVDRTTSQAGGSVPENAAECTDTSENVTILPDDRLERNPTSPPSVQNKDNVQGESNSGVGVIETPQPEDKADRGGPCQDDDVLQRDPLVGNPLMSVLPNVAEDSSEGQNHSMETTEQAAK